MEARRDTEMQIVRQTWL